MDSRGRFGKLEKKFIKSGVLFRPIKLMIFGMRPDELTERITYINQGNPIVTYGRPSSGMSRLSKNERK
jgi:hypothetical protein